MIKRSIASALLKTKKSVLLLGPRQTGKSTLIREQIKPELQINLAHEATYMEFARNPLELEERLAAKTYKSVFIDEVQRLPSLLNTLQYLLDEKKWAPKFYLSGSSARKLKRGNANLLPGRVQVFHLGPLCARELDYHLNSKQCLETGCLPGIYTEADREEQTQTLSSYAGTYLKEEIQAEALTQNLEGFSRFLYLAAHYSGHFLDFTKLASEAHISRQSATRYFEILEDTLVVNRCESYGTNTKKRLIKSPKYYFFDTGVLNALLKNFNASDDRKGLLFEHLFFNQILSSAQASGQEASIFTYRTEHGAEVDFIVEKEGKTWAIELKASVNVGPSDLRGLHHFEECHPKKAKLCVAYLGSTVKKQGEIFVYPWQELLRKME
ncbi:MAG: ATP-binding protein [Deltaproteobacteria bacterium]|nr:ATP-binding protein [Deltaproteobacteria bacterium]